jgi:hypothetical protein
MKGTGGNAKCVLPSAVCALCAALVATGCQGLGRSSSEVDPLFNGPPIPRGTPSQPAPAAPAVSANTGQGTLPPLSAPSSTTSPAALTGGVNPALDLNRDMRIGAGAGGSNPVAPVPVTTAQAGAVLRGVEPAAEPARAQPAGVTPVPAAGVALASGGRTDTYQQLQELILARGVNWQRLETVGDGSWKYSCSIPNSQNPATGRHYEAKASTDLGAIRAVLDEIDRQQSPAAPKP